MGRPKSYALKYFLPKENGAGLDVCKPMFLSTLRFSSDKRVSKFIESKRSGIDGAIAPKGDLRGKSTPVNKSECSDHYGSHKFLSPSNKSLQPKECT